LNIFTSNKDEYITNIIYDNARRMIKITNNKIHNIFRNDLRFNKIYTHEIKNKSTIDKYEYIIKKFNY
jgi:hypothetical protein